ncbi:hypothetical protein AVEN_69540-1 [Araneus ventricosus]|uniref:Uncharacterized protein n=1 Tax=Araneus ventricosus TaxID=182803 RepID=A0A4Y2RQT6_ARAVE|nr:hypothetical protein AVEN_69540-1 [Araneus ventricosus]
MVMDVALTVYDIQVALKLLVPGTLEQWNFNSDFNKVISLRATETSRQIESAAVCKNSEICTVSQAEFYDFPLGSSSFSQISGQIHFSRTSSEEQPAPMLELRLAAIRHLCEKQIPQLNFWSDTSQSWLPSDQSTDQTKIIYHAASGTTTAQPPQSDDVCLVSKRTAAPVFQPYSFFKGAVEAGMLVELFCPQLIQSM